MRQDGARRELAREPQARLALNQASNHDRIRFLGFLSDGALAEQFAGAAALVTLSTNEGFCLPVIEAMAHDCPVIAANRFKI